MKKSDMQKSYKNVILKNHKKNVGNH